jgi:uncharacterized phage protein (TIGR02218 family)
MKFFAWDSKTAAIWLYQPNWAKKQPVLTPSHVTARNTTLRNNQTRMVFNNYMRWKFEFTAFIGSSDVASEVREGLGRLKNELVFMPVWVDETGITTSLLLGVLTVNMAIRPSRYSNFFAIMDSNRNFELLNVASVGTNTLTLNAGAFSVWSPTDCIICPLLAGRFDPRPILDDATDMVSEPQVTFIEDSDTRYALVPIAQTLLSVGSAISSLSTYTMWDVRPTFDQPQTDSTEVDISIDPIGIFRQSQKTIYPQSVRRSFEYTFVCADRNTINRIENLFAVLAGQVVAFMLPTWRSDLRLLGTLPGTPANQIIIQNVTYSDPSFNTTPGKGYLALSDLTRVQPVHVTTIIGGTLTCEANVTGSWLVGKTQISHLVLVTMREDSIAWTYDSSQVATVKIKFLEVTEEYSLPAALGNPIYLYRFTHQLPTPQVYRFTSNEAAIFVPGDGTYQFGPFNHKGIKYSLDPTSDEAQIESYDFAGNPLSLITQSGNFGLNGKLICEIIETYRYNLASQIQTFYGIAVQSDPEGNKFTVTFRALDSALDQKSRMVFQRQCVWDLYGVTTCKVPKASWLYPMFVSSISGTAIYLTYSNTNIATNWFAYGYMETPGKTNLYELRSINWSNPFTTFGFPVAVQVTRPFLYLAPGDLVYLYAGCSKRWLEDCNNKFGNGINFGGVPNIPLDPPNVIGVPTKSGSGGGGKGGGGGK